MRVLLPLLLPLGSALVRVMPRAVARSLAWAGGDVCFFLLRSRRAIITANLTRTAPGATPVERRRLARRTFRTLAMIWVDVLRLPAMTRHELTSLLDPRSSAELREAIDGALAEGRGVMVVSMHLGAIDLSAAWVATNGWPVTSVGEDLAPEVFEAFRRYRSSSGLRLLSQRRAAVAAFRALTRGEIVAVVGDRLMQGPSTAVMFGGGRRFVPTGPAAFAIKADAPIVVACIVAGPAGRYQAVCRRVVVTSRDPVEVTHAIGGVFSEFVERYPDQWFVFQPDWVAEARADEEADATPAPVAYRVP